MKKSFLFFKKQNLLKILLFLIPTSLILTACGRTGAPANHNVQTVLFYYTKDKNNKIVNHEYNMLANFGNPDGNIKDFRYINEKNQQVELDSISAPEAKAKASFFASIVINALKFQKVGILARAALLRSYYSYLTNTNNQSVYLTDQKLIEKYLGSFDKNKKLFNQSENLNNNQKNNFLDYQFAFYLSNVLTQGDGFAGFPRAINFNVESIFMDLGDLTGLNFIKADKDDKTGFVTLDENKVQFNASNSFNSNLSLHKFDINKVLTDYIKINVLKVSYNFRFRQNGLDGIITDPNVVNRYFDDKSTERLIPKVFQKLETPNFNITSTNFTVWSKFDLEKKLNDDKTIKNVLTDPVDNSVTWNSFASENKLADTSLIKLTKALNDVYSFSISQRNIAQNTLDHYVDGKFKFPNNRTIEDVSKSIKAFSDLGINFINWKNLIKLNVTDLLFSLFNDYEFNSTFNDVQKITDKSWINIENNNQLIKSFTTSTDEKTNFKK